MKTVNKGINWFFSEILKIKESWNPIETEAQLPSPSQKWKSHMLPSLDKYLHAKNLRCHFLPEILLIKES